MKHLPLVLCLATLLGLGCTSTKSTSSPKPDQPDFMPQAERTTAKAYVGAGPDYCIPSPALTTSSKFASRCPYCKDLNVSQMTSCCGGSVVTNGQPILIKISDVTTNYVSNMDGTLEQWTVTYVCSCCKMPYSDYRQQLVPHAKSVQLPLLQ